MFGSTGMVLFAQPAGNLDMTRLGLEHRKRRGRGEAVI